MTNPLYKEGIFVQIRWTRCNKTYNIQCCQYPALIRILPEVTRPSSGALQFGLGYGQAGLRVIARSAGEGEACFAIRGETGIQPLDA